MDEVVKARGLLTSRRDVSEARAYGTLHTGHKHNSLTPFDAFDVRA